MTERLVITLALILFGVAGWALFNRFSIRRLAEASDPLLSGIPANLPVIVYFTTPSCVPCQTQQKPAIQQITQERPVHIIQIDASAQPEIADRWGVFSAPTTFILDKYHKPRHINRGVASAELLRKQLEE
jgi:thiol-disulfide isomerase/thioredoxin